MSIMGRMLQYRGVEQDFDADKMLPGMFAVSTDKKYVRMCFSPGVVERIALYSAFEEDMKQIQLILATCEDIRVAVEAFNDLGRQYAEKAESEADRAKNEADEAEACAIRSEEAAARAEAVTDIGIATADKAGIIKANSDEFTVSSDGKLFLTSAYEEQESLEEITGAENKKTLFGKLAKAIKEFKTHIGNNSIHYTLSNNLLATVAGTALDAVQGKNLDNKITELNRRSPNVNYVSCARGDKFAKGVSFYSVRNGICFLTVEVTTSATVTNGDIVVTGLPKPQYHIYTSMPLANGNCYSVQINASSGNLVIYYPIYTAVSRIDATLTYPIHLASS